MIALTGSGNSENIIRALRQAKIQKMKSYAIVGYDGGESKRTADKSIHLKTHDMQIAEDCQLIIGHLCMQWMRGERRLQV